MQHAYKTPESLERRTLRGLELRCPPLPQTLVDALGLIDQPAKMEIGPVTDMVQRDPIVVARLLHTVNSAYYGLRHTISSTERAVVMLGPVAVAGIVLGMHMLKLRTILDGPAGACFQRLIRHSIASAFLTRHLLDGQPGENGRENGRVGASFTAGLLHDFGKIILVYNFSEDAVAIYDQRTLDEHVSTGDERELEQLIFGCDHTEAGEFAARKFNFPDVLTDVIRLHHAPEQAAGEAGRLVRGAAAANQAAKAMGYASSQPRTWDEVLGDPVWPLLIREDLPRFDGPEAIVDELQAQQTHLDEYVQHLTSGVQAAIDIDRLAPLRDRLMRRAG